MSRLALGLIEEAGGMHRLKRSGAIEKSCALERWNVHTSQKDPFERARTTSGCRLLLQMAVDPEQERGHEVISSPRDPVFAEQPSRRSGPASGFSLEVEVSFRGCPGWLPARVVLVFECVRMLIVLLIGVCGISDL